MSGHTNSPSGLARNVVLLVVGVLVVELVFAAFLFAMARLAADGSSSDYDRALLVAAVASLVAAAVAVGLWISLRSPNQGATSAAWVARLLPVAAVAITLVVAAFGGVPWVSVVLNLFTTTPVAIVGMVVPQLVASRRDSGTVGQAVGGPH